MRFGTITRTVDHVDRERQLAEHDERLPLQHAATIPRVAREDQHHRREQHVASRGSGIALLPGSHSSQHERDEQRAFGEAQQRRAGLDLRAAAGGRQ